MSSNVFEGCTNLINITIPNTLSPDFDKQLKVLLPNIEITRNSALSKLQKSAKKLAKHDVE